jgi:mRNA interferase MazF
MIKKFHLYLADLDPPFGAEPGKSRPVVISQMDDLNSCHQTTVVCPLTTQLMPKNILRVRVLASHISGLLKDSDIMVDQVRAIDIKRIKKSLGRLTPSQAEELLEKLNILINE